MTTNSLDGDHGQPEDSRVLFLEHLVEGRADIAREEVPCKQSPFETAPPVSVDSP